jgi:hypothetical protein
MKNNIYIVYDKTNFKIIKSFDWFNQAEDFSKTNIDYQWINRTHPKHKDLLIKLIY